MINSSTRFLIPVLGLFVVAALTAGLYQFYRRSAATIAEQARREELSRMAIEAASAWDRVQQHFEAGACEQAAELFERSIRSPVGDLARAGPDVAMPDGADPASWLIRHEGLYREQAGRATRRLMDGLATGAVNPRRLDIWLEQHDYPEIRQESAARGEAILAARRSAATNWFRVFLEEKQPLEGLAPLVERVYRARWPDEHPLQLVFGPALSGEEQAATAKTLAIRATLGHASFTVSPENQHVDPDWTPPEVPILLSLSNRVLQARAGLTGPWDRAGPYHTYLNPPRVISKNFADRILDNYRRQLLKGIEQALDALPPHPLPASP